MLDPNVCHGPFAGGRLSWPIECVPRVIGGDTRRRHRTQALRQVPLGRDWRKRPVSGKHTILNTCPVGKKSFPGYGGLAQVISGTHVDAEDHELSG